MIVIDENKMTNGILMLIAERYGYKYVDSSSDAMKETIDKFVEEHYIDLDTVINAIKDLNGLIKEPFENMN